MSIFKRMRALIKGMTSSLLGKVEEENPGYLIENVKNQIEKMNKQAEQQIIEVLTNAESVKIKRQEAEDNLHLIRSKIQAATKHGDKEILVALIMQEESAEKVFLTYDDAYKNTQTEVTKIKAEYKEYESRMNIKLNELEALSSQASMAQLRKKVTSLNSEFSYNNDISSQVNDDMKRINEVVNKQTATANALESLHKESLESKLQQFDSDLAKKRALEKAETLLGNKINSEDASNKF